MRKYRALRWSLQLIISILLSWWFAEYMQAHDLPLWWGHIFAIVTVTPVVLLEIAFAEGYLHE